jgi:hypothetical protein
MPTCWLEPVNSCGAYKKATARLKIVFEASVVIDGWTVIHFSYEQIKEQPRRYRQIIQQAIRRWLGDELDQTSLSSVKKEALRPVIRKGETISPIEVEKYLRLGGKTVKKVISQLVDKKLLIPASGIIRVRSLRLGDWVNNQLINTLAEGGTG